MSQFLPNPALCCFSPPAPPEPVVPVFGRDFFQHNMAAPVTFNNEGVWNLVDQVVRVYEGGTYTFDFVAIWGTTTTAKLISLRALLDGAQAGGTIARESKDPLDLQDYTTFLTIPLAAGSHTIRLEAQQAVGGGTDNVVVNLFRLRGYRIA